MLFMVIERFRDNDAVPVYRHLRDKGRSLPDGLEYIDSWVEPNFSRCFQLMKCDDLKLFQQWALQWRNSGVALEIVPVVTKKHNRSSLPILIRLDAHRDPKSRDGAIFESLAMS